MVTADLKAPTFTGLTSDSRQVRPGYLFAALAGTRADGAQYVKDAVARGAVAVLGRAEIAPEATAIRQMRITDSGGGDISRPVFLSFEGDVAPGEPYAHMVPNRVLTRVLLEAVSAFATAGLSTGLTPELTAPAKYVLAVLMFIGRTGTMTLAAALALRNRRRVIRLPEERPIIG